MCCEATESEPQLLSLCSGTWELQLLSPHALEPELHNRRSRAVRSPHTAPGSLQLERSLHGNKDPTQP